MEDFLRSYGIWIALGVLLLIMVRSHSRGHGGGGGCGMGHEAPAQDGKGPSAKGGAEKTTGSSCH